MYVVLYLSLLSKKTKWNHIYATPPLVALFKKLRLIKCCAYSSDSWPVFVVPVPPLQTISEGVCVCGVSCCLSAAFVSGAYVCMYVCLLELLAGECIPFMCCCRSGFYSFRTFVFLAFLPHSSHFFFRFFFRSRSTTFHCCLTDRNSRVLCYVTHTHTPIYKCQ